MYADADTAPRPVGSTENRGGAILGLLSLATHFSVLR